LSSNPNKGQETKECNFYLNLIFDDFLLIQLLLLQKLTY